MSDWPINGIDDDVRSRMFDVARSGRGFALATIASADSGPRPVGSQMVITENASWGFLSGGCIEDDVARNGRTVLADGQPRRLIYGRGSPFIDIRLPCGGRLEVFIERISSNDASLWKLEYLTMQRRPAMWRSNGFERTCKLLDASENLADAVIRRRYDPHQRLLVVGTDAFALALAGLAATVGWETTLLAPFGPSSLPPFGVACDRRSLKESLAATNLDPWTAVAVATHDLEADEAALVPALASSASYVGVLGSRRRLEERKERLLSCGMTAKQIAKLHAPIGLAIRARSPGELAVAVVAQIISAQDSPCTLPATREPANATS